jgi:hypothetical protein
LLWFGDFVQTNFEAFFSSALREKLSQPANVGQKLFSEVE